MFEGINPLVLPLGFFFGTCSLVGVTGNFIILCATIKSKRLRSPCHILIAINCFADMIHETGQFPFSYNVFSQTQVAQKDCYWILFVPLIGCSLGAPMILAMGIDRLIAIVFPANNMISTAWYTSTSIQSPDLRIKVKFMVTFPCSILFLAGWQKFRGKYRLYQEIKVKYVLCQMIFPTVYTVYLMFLGWRYRIDGKFECAVPVGLMGGFAFFTYSGYVLYISIIGLYIFAAYELKKKGGSARFKAVFISIAITVGLVVFGWMCTTAANTLSYQIFPTDPFLQAVMQQYAGITVNISTASNFFVFYLKNAEYRVAVRKLFGLSAAPSDAGAEASSMTANAARKMSVVTVQSIQRKSTHSVVAVVR